MVRPSPSSAFSRSRLRAPFARASSSFRRISASCSLISLSRLLPSTAIPPIRYFILSQFNIDLNK